MLEARPGICIRCDARGVAGAPCETRTCKKTKTHLIPEEYAKRADDPGFLLEPMIGRLVDDWLVVDVLGRGGFGVVYLVLQLPIFLRAALKLLHRDSPTPDETPAQALARRAAQSKFTGEAQALASLTHPGVVRLLKYGVFDAAPYLVMEFAPGRALADAMDASPKTGDIYRLDNAHYVLRQLVNALEAAHDNRIVHRDIKPGNIVLQNLPGDPFFVRVLDFGIAKFLSEGSKTSLSAGTPIYMAPEQFDRQKIGPWSDLYAVGVVTFELLFGQPPFEASTVERVLAKKLAPDADPLVDIRGRVPPAVEAFFDKALARRPEDRYATAAELRAGLDELFVAARSVPRDELLDLLQPRYEDHAYSPTDLAPGPPDITENDTRTGVVRRWWPWLFGISGLAAAAAGVALLASPVSTPHADPTTLPASAPTSVSQPDTLEPREPETVEPDTVEPDTVEPDTVDPETTEPDTVEPEPDTIDLDLIIATPPEDAAPAHEPDTRQRPTRTRDASSSPADTSAPPRPDASPSAPDVRETRPYSFVD